MLQTYLFLRKDLNLNQMISEYGLFVIPTMPLVTKIMLYHPQFKETFGSLPWDRYLGNWYSAPVVNSAVPPVMPPVIAPGYSGVTAWAANQPWLQQQQVVSEMGGSRVQNQEIC